MVNRYLVCIILLSLFSCSKEIELANITEAQSKNISNNSIIMADSKIESSLKVVGTFSNVESDGEHQWGYSIALWRQDNKIYGLISGDDDLKQLIASNRNYIQLALAKKEVANKTSWIQFNALMSDFDHSYFIK